MQTQPEFFVISGLLFIPFFYYLRNYRVLAAGDYLLMGTLFLAGSFSTLLSGLGEVNTLAIQLSLIYIFAVLTKTSFSLLAGKFVWHHSYWFIGYSIVAIAIVLTSRIEGSAEIELVEYVLIDGLRVVTGLIVIYCYRRANIVLETPRTRLVRYFFIFIGISFVIMGLVRVMVAFGLLVRLYSTGLPIEDYANLLVSVDLGIVVWASFITLGIFVISLVAPEHLIISHVQILKTARIYDIFEKNKEIKLRDVSTRFLLEYISSLPPELFAENGTQRERN